ncbi:CDP-diacylglycerol--serine O-phosphatidyltransferase [Chondrinema litorale]|uniref:CDP-diacylglycerol--serine O-phosphatidyltransferase n=1 Tax=Chondrinema litorale TaxID=2994555 RepID=UPI0025432046|nr:CDP-diacylglycerol--serine O-phosphatidyltransferase [Chondrinema litorale]UZR93914.1 CDP-diacylglycerol--serine O-phosphatidyltransferase [Chondrinema litorale]
MIKKNIPNYITLGNLLCGILAIHQIYSGNYTLASWLIAIAALLDFSDGFAARMLKVSSPMGKELDSLADMVTFGLAPAMILFNLYPEPESPLRYITLLIALASAWRLAKFNIDTRQSDSFLGVPTPASALFIGSLPLIFQQSPNLEAYLTAPVYLIISVFLSIAMVVELPLFSLKFKKFGFAENKVRYLFLIGSILLLIFLQFIALPVIVVIYIIISLIVHLANSNNDAATSS